MLQIDDGPLSREALDCGLAGNGQAGMPAVGRTKTVQQAASQPRQKVLKTAQLETGKPLELKTVKGFEFC
jgi:hypothetical protein